jgi:hypothetical protein
MLQSRFFHVSISGFKAARAPSNRQRRIEQEKYPTSSLNHWFTSSCPKVTETVASNTRAVRNANPLLSVAHGETAFHISLMHPAGHAARGFHLFRLRGNGSCTGACVTAAIALGGNCVRALSEPSLDRTTFLDLICSVDFRFRALLHDRQQRVPETLYRMEQRVLACVADSVRAECVAPKEPVIVGCGTGRLNRGEHRGSRLCPSSACTGRRTKRLSRHRAAIGGIGLEDIREHLTMP